MNGSERYGWIIFHAIAPHTVAYMRADGREERPADPRCFFPSKEEAWRAARRVRFANAEFAKTIMP